MTSAPPDSPAEPDTLSSRGRHRPPTRPRGLRRAAYRTAAGVLGIAVAGAGYVLVKGHGGTVIAELGRPTVPPPVSSAPSISARPGATGAPDAAPSAIPGLGPRTRARIPAATRQVLVASGKAKDSDLATVTLWTRGRDGHWHAGDTWPAHNALRGWTPTHHAGDLHSPIGVFTLSDAGGFDRDPGSRLPYLHSSRFRAGGVGFDGEPLDTAFDYVIAINYNRVPGRSPLDGTQPLGPARGGGIWVHVDHGGPTHGCVSVSAAHMVDLLRTLTPAEHPVIVMGDGASLAR